MNIIRWFKSKISKPAKKDTTSVSRIDDGLRINRMIRTKYQNGDYIVVNEHLHHYLFEIDGESCIMSIVEVDSAIRVLEED